MIRAGDAFVQSILIRLRKRIHRIGEYNRGLRSSVLPQADIPVVYPEITGQQKNRPKSLSFSHRIFTLGTSIANRGLFMNEIINLLQKTEHAEVVVSVRKLSTERNIFLAVGASACYNKIVESILCSLALGTREHPLSPDI